MSQSSVFGAAPARVRSRLSFKGKLASKGVSTDRLLRDLKTVQVELAQMDQDDVDLDSLLPITKQLVQPTLMLHKDRGVKIALACCLADVLRLFAPDAPYTALELRVRPFASGPRPAECHCR